MDVSTDTSTRFALVADHLALDFLNTAAGSEGVSVEGLVAPADVLAWLVHAGATDGATAARVGASPPDARVLLAEALRLRDALARAVPAWTGGTLVPDDAVAALDRVVAARSETHRVVRRGGACVVESVPIVRGTLGLLAPVALAAATLLATADPARVRRCDGPGCGLWFLDASRNGSRRWCSMARCGNRVKVAAHNRRKRAADR